MQWWLFGFTLEALVLLIVLIIILGIVIQGFFLGVGLGFVNGSNRELGSTFVTALMMSLVLWIPCLGCILAWYFIKSRHDVGWGGALAAWILGAIVQLIVMIILLLFVFTSIWALLFAAIPFP
jgi:hypothetical protein